MNLKVRGVVATSNMKPSALILCVIWRTLVRHGVMCEYRRAACVEMGTLLHEQVTVRLRTLRRTVVHATKNRGTARTRLFEELSAVLRAGIDATIQAMVWRAIAEELGLNPTASEQTRRRHRLPFQQITRNAMMTRMFQLRPIAGCIIRRKAFFGPRN